MASLLHECQCNSSRRQAALLRLFGACSAPRPRHVSSPQHTSAILIFCRSSSAVTVTGWLLRGMSITVVVPPAAAAAVPVATPGEAAADTR
jgi:hypothetical protein